MPIWRKLSSMHCHTAGQRTEWNSSKKQKLREEISRPNLTRFHDLTDFRLLFSKVLLKGDWETGKLCEDLRLKSFLRMLPSNDNESIMS
jgi:hypothetical protein